MTRRTRVEGPTVWLSVLAITCLSSCAGSVEPVDLRLQLRKGNAYAMRRTLELTFDEPDPWIHPAHRVSVSTDLGFDVLETKSNGTGVVKLTLQAAREVEHRGQQTFVYDSSKPEVVPEFAESLAPLVGKSFTLMIDPSANLEEERVLEQDADSPHDLEQFKSLIVELMRVHPRRPVRLGESWGKVYRQTYLQQTPWMFDCTFTLQSRGRGRAVIQETCQITTAPNPPPVPFDRLEVIYDMSGTMRQTFTLDETTGWVRNMDGRLTAAGKATVSKGYQDVKVGRSWPVRFEMVSKIEPLEVM